MFSFTFPDLFLSKVDLMGMSFYDSKHPADLHIESHCSASPELTTQLLLSSTYPLLIKLFDQFNFEKGQ